MAIPTSRAQAIVEGLKATGTVGAASAILGGLAYTSAEDHVAPAAYPWSHTGPFSSFDAAAYAPPPARNFLPVHTRGFMRIVCGGLALP